MKNSSNTAQKVSNRQNLAVGLIWFFTVFFGFFLAAQYRNRPGTPADARLVWPIHSHLNRIPQRSTLLIFAHPHCPCSKATIYELERILPNLKEPVDTKIVFVQPKETSESWVRTDIFELASAIPGVQVQIDKDLNEAKKFDAQTSGQTFLYDPFGQLLFSGGITPGRGHAGDSIGKQFLLDWASGKKIAAIGRTNVFGCALGGGKLNEAQVETQ